MGEITEAKRCGGSFYNAAVSRRHQCQNIAKYGDYCGVHSPERQAERAQKRGPTQFEREATNRKARKDEFERFILQNQYLKNVVYAARLACECENCWHPELTSALASHDKAEQSGDFNG